MLRARRRYAQSLSSVSAPAGRFGGIDWVLSRGLCRFGRFDLANVPKAQRRQAVLLQIRQWSSYPRTDWLAVFDDNAASVWIWDKDKVDQSVEEARLNRRRVRVLPEALLHKEMAEGQRLVKSMDGFEGQVWRGGTLMHSRWWPALPDLPNLNALTTAL